MTARNLHQEQFLQEEILFVRLEDTAAMCDPQVETLFSLLRENPFLFFKYFLIFLQNRSFFSQIIAPRLKQNGALLPLNEEVINFVKVKKDEGAFVYLYSESSEKITKDFFLNVDIFDDYIISAPELREKTLSEKGQMFSKVTLLSNCPDDRAGFYGIFKEIMPRNSKNILELLRAKQWMKNILLILPVFVPQSLLGQRWNFFSVPALCAALLIFCLASSVIYIFNDILDLEADRLHEKKKNRALASGKMGVLEAFYLSCFLLISCVFLAFLLSRTFCEIVLLYFFFGLFYSLSAKKLFLIDAFFLGILHDLRIVAGCSIVGLNLPQEFLVGATFLFASLALQKRYAELVKLAGKGLKAATGRSYLVEQKEVVLAVGGACGILSIIFLSSYISNPTVTTTFYNPKYLFAPMAILFIWCLRFWYLAAEQKTNEEQIEYVVKDPFSVLAFMLMIAVYFLAV